MKIFHPLLAVCWLQHNKWPFMSLWQMFAKLTWKLMIFSLCMSAMCSCALLPPLHHVIWPLCVTYNMITAQSIASGHYLAWLTNSYCYSHPLVRVLARDDRLNSPSVSLPHLSLPVCPCMFPCCSSSSATCQQLVQHTSMSLRAGQSIFQSGNI